MTNTSREWTFDLKSLNLLSTEVSDSHRRARENFLVNCSSLRRRVFIRNCLNEMPLLMSLSACMGVSLEVVLALGTDSEYVHDEHV